MQRGTGDRLNQGAVTLTPGSVLPQSASALDRAIGTLLLQGTGSISHQTPQGLISAGGNTDAPAKVHQSADQRAQGLL